MATEVSAATVVVPLVLVVFADACAWATSIRDPGILPRSAWVPPEVARDPDAMVAVHNYKNYRKTVYRAVAVNGATVAVKFCYTCCIYVPPRANHCSECDACIGPSPRRVPLRRRTMAYGETHMFVPDLDARRAL